MSERIPGVEDIRQALRHDGWTLDEADEGIDRIKRRGIGIGHLAAQENMQASIGAAFREAKAEAWDEGAAKGSEVGADAIILNPMRANPYREGGDE